LETGDIEEGLKAASAIGDDKLQKQAAKRDHALAGLRDSEGMFRAFIETASDFMLTADGKGNISYVNKAMRKTLGYSKKEMIGMHISRLISQESMSVYQSLIEELVSKGSSTSELILVTKDNGKFHGQVKVVAIYDEQGGFIGSSSVFRDLTERYQMETAIRESENKFSKAFRSSAAIMAISTFKDGIFVDVNDEFLKVMGFDYQEVIGKTAGDLGIYKVNDRRENLKKEVEEKGYARNIEVKVKTKSGEVKYGSFCADIIQLKNEKCWLTMIHDITERKQMEGFIRIQHELGIALSATRESKEALALVIDTAISVDGLDMGGIYLCNPVTGDFHLEYAKNLTPEFFNQISHLDRGSIQADFIMKGKPRYINYEKMSLPVNALQKREGIKTLAVIPILYQGEVIGSINIASSTLEEIPLAARNLLESVGSHVGGAISRLRTEIALRESEEKYRRLVESTSDWVWAIDLQGCLTYSNRAIKAHLGYDIKKMMGHSTFSMIHSDERERSEKLFNKAVKRKKGWKNFTMRWLHKDGSIRFFESTAKPILDTDGEITGFTGIDRDISARKRAEEQKERLEQQLQQAQKMEALGTLAGGIAHDFNNTLAVINGFSELALIQNEDNKRLHANMEQVLRAVRRGKDLVNQILAFSRQMDQERKPFDIRHILNDILKLLRASLPATVELKLNIQAKSGTAFIDPTQIHQVLMNLCSNAAYAMREKGGTLEIKLTEEVIGTKEIVQYPELKQGAFLRLSLKDTGQGIKSADMDRIFNPFFTTKELGEGSGLGLSVVHGIVKNHKGAIRVSSWPGKGTTFHILFPKINKKALQITDVFKPLSKNVDEARILFIDDQSILANAGKQMLENQGYHVIAQTSSVDALDIFRSQPSNFDLVVTDMTMPKMTGADLAKEILTIRKDIPIILCTGYSEKINPDNAKDIGIREMLMKPFSAHELIGAIQKVLAQV